MMDIDSIITVLQAYKEGKKLQHRVLRSDSPWLETVVFTAAFNSLEYRVKSEPRKFRIVLDDNGTIMSTREIDKNSITYLEVKYPLHQITVQEVL